MSGRNRIVLSWASRSLSTWNAPSALSAEKAHTFLSAALVSVTQIFDVPVYSPADTDHGALLSKYSTGIVCAGHAMRVFSVFFSVFSAVYIALCTPFSPFTTPNPSCVKDGLRRQRRLVRSDRLSLPFPDIHVSRRAALSVCASVSVILECAAPSSACWKSSSDMPSGLAGSSPSPP